MWCFVINQNVTFDEVDGTQEILMKDSYKYTHGMYPMHVSPANILLYTVVSGPTQMVNVSIRLFICRKIC